MEGYNSRSKKILPSVVVWGISIGLFAATIAPLLTFAAPAHSPASSKTPADSQPQRLDSKRSLPLPTAESLTVDRIFEDVQLAVRLTRTRLQFYTTEGVRVTQWYEAALSEDQSRTLWGAVEDAKLDALEEEYRPAPQARDAPPLVREVDYLVVRLQSADSERLIRVHYRPEGPASLSHLVQTLEQAALSMGERQGKFQNALLAKDLSTRNYPRNESIAATLRRGGARFFEASDKWLEENHRVLEALKSPGWLVPAEAIDVPSDLVLPVYLRAWGQYDFQITVLSVTLIEDSG